MDKQINIDDLLNKFKQGTLSPAEAKELVSIVECGDANQALKQSLTFLWQKSVQEDSNAPTDKMLNKLRHSIHRQTE